MNQVGIFLDRDGTVNFEVEYLSSVSDLKLIPGSSTAIKEANQLGWKVFIITNQSGVARGIISEIDLEKIHQILQATLAQDGASLDAIYYCPHHPEIGESHYRKECDCRKPKAGMIDRAAKEFKIDLTKSFVIGDKMIDIQTGNNCGAKSILVLTGYGKEELKLCQQQNVKIDFIADNLYDAIQFIKRTVQQEIPTLH
jgi:D-glycero-D-manno-heptose 1,7-bisphosphate phosphatase